VGIRSVSPTPLLLMDLLSGLNPQQREAVTHTSGPVLIFAGAGSGKTRTLTHRIAHLVSDEGVSPGRILAVTFTNKAAREMGERLEALLGSEVRRMWLGTFHALCARMLRIHGERIGIDPRFAIFDADDQAKLIKDILKEFNLDSNRFPAARLLGRISDAKNALQTAEEFEAAASRPHEKVYASVYTRYQARLRAASSLDFDDLLFEAVRLLRTDTDSREYWSERFLQIHIDEFQDVNEAQFEWARLLASKHRNICVVGDDDQSIYAWRGANVRIILEFEERYQDAKVIRLEQNYRSTQHILDAAHGVISNNLGRAQKRLWTEKPGGEKLVLHGAINAVEEAMWVVRRIEMLKREEKRPNQDFVILCRINAQSRPFEEAFLRSRLPLKLVGTQRFYERREIRDLLAYLKFIYNPGDGVSTSRLINVPPRGIGTATVTKLEGLALERRTTLGGLLLDEAIDSILTPAVARKVLPLSRLLVELRAQVAESKSLAELLERVIERTQYLEFLRNEKDGDEVDREANVMELLRAAEAFDERLASEIAEVGENTEVWDVEDKLHLGQFLAETALAGGTDKEANEDDAVTLMTLHAAKGLEFPVVFVAGLEQSLLPHSRALWGEGASDEDLEEERRLLYVGLTRARERAFLSYAVQRTLHGHTETSEPSQFIDEIPSHVVEREGLASGGLSAVPRGMADWNRPRSESDLNYGSSFGAAAPSRYGATSDARSPFGVSATRTVVTPDEAPLFRVGDKVKHATYGVGVVTEASPQGGVNEWVRIAFLGDAGLRKLVVAFASLEKVD